MSIPTFLTTLLVLALTLLPRPLLAESLGSVSQPAMVIIIDDIGNNYAQGKAAVELPGPLSYAVLPHSPHGRRLAQLAVAADKDVMLHAPMQNSHDRPLGPGALTRDLSREAFLEVLDDDLDSVPIGAEQPYG